MPFSAICLRPQYLMTIIVIIETHHLTERISKLVLLPRNNLMQSLVEKISGRTGIDRDKAMEALLTVSEHVKTEFPLLHSVVDLVLGTQGFSVNENKSSVTDFSEHPIIYN